MTRGVVVVCGREGGQWLSGGEEGLARGGDGGRDESGSAVRSRRRSAAEQSSQQQQAESWCEGALGEERIARGLKCGDA